MARWKIDEFSVKPSGFLASWRYIAIYVDDDGIITYEDVPGKPSINLDNLDDYSRVSRNYGSNDAITHFCNLSTFTHYYVRSSNFRPFAVTTTVLNDPACGYQTPLPEPAVPFNPFGNTTYKGYREFEFCDVDYQTVNVLIEKKDYEGEIFPIELGGSSPVTLSYKEVDTKYETIRPLECVLRFVVNEDFLLQEFYTEDERTFRVTVTKQGVIKFRGYIIPDSCNEPFNAPPYEVSIKCTDALGGLKTVTYPLPVGQTFDLQQSFKDILCYCLAPLNLNLNLATICNLYEKKMPNGMDDDPIDLVTVNPLRFATEKGTIMTSYDVIHEICKGWGAEFVQIDGVWHFVRTNERANDVVRRRTYNYKGLRLYSDQLNTKRMIGGPI